MSQRVEAIYRKGVLYPMKPLKGLKENATVQVTVEMKSSAHHPLEKFAGILSAEEADHMLRVVDAEFEQVETNAW